MHLRDFRRSELVFEESRTSSRSAVVTVLYNAQRIFVASVAGLGSLYLMENGLNMLENEKHYKDNIAGDLSRGSTSSNKVNNACANVSVFTVAVNQAKRSTRSSAHRFQSEEAE